MPGIIFSSASVERRMPERTRSFLNTFTLAFTLGFRLCLNFNKNKSTAGITRYHKRHGLAQVQVVLFGCLNIIAGCKGSKIYLIVALCLTRGTKDERVTDLMQLTSTKVIWLAAGSLLESMAHYKPVVYLFFIVQHCHHRLIFNYIYSDQWHTYPRNSDFQNLPLL